MKLFVDQDHRELYGECDACKGEISLVKFEAAADPWGYYEASDIVDKWVNHQLNDCKAPLVDNSAEGS